MPPSQNRDGQWGQFDWIDLLVMLVVIVPVIMLSQRVGITSRWGAPFILGPLVARRAVFGMPARGRMRTGGLWSLSGLVALFLLLFGFGGLALGVWALANARAAEPDWSTVPLTHRERDVFQIQLPTESAEEFAQRSRAEGAEREQRWRAEEAATHHEEWLASRARGTTVGLECMGVGLVLLALGILLDRARYDRAALGGVVPPLPPVPPA